MNLFPLSIINPGLISRFFTWLLKTIILIHAAVLSNNSFNSGYTRGSLIPVKSSNDVQRAVNGTKYQLR
ncbi:hypothetical protein HanRHA438_Chr05g0207481 [Helianthus annuus]|nr:hypothetical protein HanHA300_Chr05g0162521 [Helianthus annuus]KAJ0583422.1 hypothetical protein HanHA89_Chr05g0176371 [Helianthus annuus]KAJ0749162.1 hypothetical protein HanLR1_Chr05g0166611 [Helianthus annuus]KAJ0917572.1 hypothetical protein HanRHA438_Chr05g0207481 [Helianthus annuus]